jgi:transposase
LSGLGHDAKLIPPIYVKPFVKRQKNDMADAEAIAEAASRPTMRVVTVAIANKTARTAWALLAKGENYRIAPAI